MKYKLIFILTTTIYVFTPGQSPAYIFKNLPPDLTPDLTIEQRDSLLQKGEFIVPGGDLMETIKYEIDTSEATNYLRYEYFFTTGQSGFITFEIKTFTKTNGQSFAVLSRCGGLAHSYNQQDLRIFNLIRGKLVENTKQKLLPQNIPLELFLKKETHSSAKKRIEESVSSCYSLQPDKKNELEFTMSPQVPIEQYEHWIMAYSIIFKWTGTKFEQKPADKN